MRVGTWQLWKATKEWVGILPLQSVWRRSSGTSNSIYDGPTVFVEGRKHSSPFSPCSLRRVISFCFLWMRSLALEIFASEKSDTQMKGRVRKPVAGGVNEKRYLLLWCVCEEWHKALCRTDPVGQKDTHLPSYTSHQALLAGALPSLPVQIC